MEDDKVSVLALPICPPPCFASRLIALFACRYANKEDGGLGQQYDEWLGIGNKKKTTYERPLLLMLVLGFNVED